MRRSGRILNGTRSGWRTPQDSPLQFQTPVHTPRNDPPKKSLSLAQPPPHRCRTFPLLPVQMGYGLLCGLWVWRRTNRRPCRPSLSNPSTPPRTTRPDGFGRWDNRMAAQHLPRYLGGPAVDKRTRSNERKKRHSGRTNHQGNHTTLLLSETLLSTAQASQCVGEVRSLESTGSPCGEFWSQISTCIL